MDIFPKRGFYELTFSKASETYVWKEETRVAGSQFELGVKPFNRNSKEMWKDVKDAAKSGDLDNIPDDIYIRFYRTLQAIASDHSTPVAVVRKVIVYWGETGTGKSRRAWEEAGVNAYPKDPRSKFWCGYRAEKNVIIDEFRGGIDISHLLRWTDRYPVRVEIKGSSKPLTMTHLWITSNLHPDDWYPDLDRETRLALLRRIEVIKIT